MSKPSPMAHRSSMNISSENDLQYKQFLEGILVDAERDVFLTIKQLGAGIMSTSPAKHKSSHHHHHHHHKEHHHSSSISGNSGGSTIKAGPNLSSYIKIADNSKLLPRYSVALSKPHDECLPMEELDAIQMEVESLLSSVALRYRALKVEYVYLEDRKHQKKNADKSSSPGTSGKRKRDDKKSSKDSSRYGHTKHSKLKSNSSNSPAHSQHTDSGAADMHMHPYPNASAPHSHTNHKLILPKNDAPNKFWLSVEPYCMPITQEDIKLLDDLIDDYTEPLVPSIPEIGPHYAVRWASDDIRDEQDNSKSNKKTSGSNPTDTNDMKKPNEKVMGQGICGPLTQHLISALLDENTEMQSDIVGCSDSIVQDSSDSCTENNSSSANRTQTTAITSLLKSGIDVEKRLKKELLDLGILEPSDFSKDKDDEVLGEIKRVRTELQAIAEYNRGELKMLKAAAKEEMKRLEVKRKLDRIDQEIIEAYKRVCDAKQKRRPLSKHERNEIYRLADEQKRLSDQLEAMPIPGLNFAVGTTQTTATSSTKTAPASNTSKA